MSSDNEAAPPAAHVYRTATLLGRALQETLDELLQENAVSGDHALRLMRAFDVAMRDALRSAATDTLCVSMATGSLDQYRYVDDVWSLVLHDVQLTLYETPFVPTTLRSARCKVVVCNSDFARDAEEAAASDKDDDGESACLGDKKRARLFT